MSDQHHHPRLDDHSAGAIGARRGERHRLFWVMVLTFVTMVGEIAGGLWTGSISLLGDAFHMLTHFLAIALSWGAILIACRPAPADKTYRWWRVEILASLIEQEMSLGDMLTLLKLRRGSYSLVSETLRAGAGPVGRALRDISFPRNSVVCAVLRSGGVVIPRGDVVFEQGDEVLALVDEASAAELAALFAATA